MIFQNCCLSKNKGISIPSFTNCKSLSKHSRLSKEVYRENCKDVNKDVIIIKSCTRAFWVETDYEGLDEGYHVRNRSTCSFPYEDSEDAYGEIRGRSSTSKFLDWITMCFWKCTPGCQELPTIGV